MLPTLFSACVCVWHLDGKPLIRGRVGASLPGGTAYALAEKRKMMIKMRTRKEKNFYEKGRTTESVNVVLE